KEQKECYDALVAIREAALKNMGSHAQDGSGWFSKLYKSVSGDFTTNQKRFLTTQADYITDIHRLDAAIQQQLADYKMARASESLIDIAETNMRFARAQREGKTNEADFIAVGAFATYGRAIFALAPDIAAELQKSGSGANENPFARLYRTGDVQFSTIPVNFEAGKTKPANAALAEVNKGASVGLDMLKSVKPRVEGDSHRLPLFFKDAGVVRQEAFAGIDASPTMRKFNKLVSDVHLNLKTLETQVQMMKAGGDRYEEFLADVNARGDAITKAFSELTDEEKTFLFDMRASWDKALKDGSIKDPEAQLELRTRLEQLDKGLALFEKDSWSKLHPEKQARREELTRELQRLDSISWNWATTQPPNDSFYNQLLEDPHYGRNATRINHRYWQVQRENVRKELTGLNVAANQRQNVDTVLAYLKSPDARDPSTFRRWLEHEGLELVGSIAGAVLATAFVVASGGSGALLLAAAGSAGMIAGSQLTKEVQHSYGLRNDGSVFGEVYRGTLVPDGLGGYRKMELVRDALVPLLFDFFEQTAMMYAGGKIGHVLGAPLARIHGALRGSRSAATILEASKKDPFANAFVKALKLEGYRQPTFSAGTMIVEEGVKQAAHEISKSGGNDKAISFLAIVISSALFRGLKPEVRRHQFKNEAMDALPQKPGRPDVDLSLWIEGKLKDIELYTKGARQRNSLIEPTADGFIETTADGTRIEFTRRPTEKPASVEIETARPEAASIAPESAAQPGKQPTTEIKKGDPAQIREQMKEMMKPLEAKINELDSLHKEFGMSDTAYEASIKKLPATADGAAKAKELTAERERARRNYEAKRTELEAEIERAQREIEGSDRYRSLELALSVAEGVFPTGEYRLKVPGQAKDVVLTVGYAPAKPGETGKVSRAQDADVPVEHVNEILAALEKAGVVPDNLSIINRSNTLVEGGFGTRGNFYEIVINTGVGRQPLRMIYNHESGHLFDRALLQKVASPEVQADLLAAYRAGLESGKPAEAAARANGVECTEAFRKEFNRQMLDPANRDVLTDRQGEPMFPEKYHASQGELIAEMFKLYQESQLLSARGENLTFEQLVDRFVKPQNPARAEMMRGFEKYYEILSSKVFPQAQPTASLPRNTKTGKADAPSIAPEKGPSDGSDPFADASNALKAGSFEDAYLLSMSVEPGKTTAEFRAAVRDRILTEVKNPSTTANPTELADLARLLNEAERAPIKDAIKTYLEQTIQDSLTPWEAAKLAREFGHLEVLKDAATTRINNELASKDPILTPLEMVKLAKEFDVFKDSVKRSILPKLVEEAITGGDNVIKLKRLLADESGIARDPEFLDTLADGIARRVSEATPETIFEIDNIIRTIPELKLTEQPRLSLEAKTAKLLDELETAISGTEIYEQIKSTLNEPDILSNNAKLNDLYSALKNSNNKRIRDFIEKHNSKDGLISAWKELIKTRDFSEVMRDPDLASLLTKRPLLIEGKEGVLSKFKELLKKAGFPANGEQIIGLDDKVLTSHLRQKARVLTLQDAIYGKVEQELKAGAPETVLDQWRSIAKETNEFRSMNAIDYMKLNGEAFNGRFIEGIPLNEFQLRELHEVVRLSAQSFSEVPLAEFQALLGQFGYEAKQNKGTSHGKILTPGGSPLTYKSGNNTVTAGYATVSGRTVKPCYQQNFLEGLQWIILRGQSRKG
ncbi:MAG: hypothetical protein K2Z81_28060, partial [Cyanobacteria bacterium]|nr:hypothetical protein [Cyanobacteriota bacterium]